MIMAELKSPNEIWPTKLGVADDMYAVVDGEKDHAEFLVFASSEKGKTLVRDNGAWFEIDENFFDDIDDPKYAPEFVDVDFIRYYDAMQRTSDTIPFYSAKSFEVDDVEPQKNTEIPVLTAAVDADGDACPVATTDIAVNLKNRQRAIRTADYGPMNPNEDNTDYWVGIGDLWGVSAAEARKSTCGNCVFFFVTTKMKNCIAEGLGGNDPWDSIDAGELGYCEAFDFKCASARTCAAWAAGGPITDKSLDKKGVQR